ncbi:MAG: type II toxin-antitoxin system RatA family toxin [Nevskiaceae bacterium]|jgi:ribosome-associated toxin RatA of RatAB toxin-antitoxin module|nr:type II toxin-antitoxin system RatA family toxin [Nevskiaceae bacterium]
MRKLHRSALVAATPERMFELINDVESYPKFVPGCRSARVLERGEGGTVARLEVGSGPLKMAFTTRNVPQPPHGLTMDLVEGPFKSLHGVWTLTPVLAPEGGQVLGCRVELTLSFELAGGLAALALGPLLERTAGSLVEAFASRARAGSGGVAAV